jgi:acetate kinase
MSEVILIFNAGSTSVKFAAYTVEDRKALILLNHGEIDGLRTNPRFVAKDPVGNTQSTHEFGKGQDLDHRAALHYVIIWLEQDVADAKVVAPATGWCWGASAMRLRC